MSGTGWTRRRFLAATGVAGAGIAGGLGLRAALTDDEPVPAGYQPAWPDGVAAGDPHPDTGVILTRVAPPTADEPVPVRWEVSDDEGFGSLVASGAIAAEPATDWTVKVPVDGLSPDSRFHYRFKVGDEASPIGRLRTAPDGDTPSLRFGYASCQQINDSLYVAHQAAAAENLDYFMLRRRRG
jgi:alkaline phosphatase D